MTERDSMLIVRLLASPWFEVARLAGGVVEVVRTERGFDSLEEIEQAHLAVERALDLLPRDRLGIVVDLRRAPARNDPEFERVMPRHRARLFEGFAARAIVVSTAVGVLQVKRHMKQDGFDVGVFTDVADAVAHCNARFARSAGA